jgi:hypothetical protein
MIIPGGSESQILVPGNPVPIHSSADSRMMGEALNSLGRGMTALGDHLDNAAKLASSQGQKNLLNNLEVRGMKEVLNARIAQEGAAIIPGDKDGRLAVDAYRKRAEEGFNAIAESISDPEVRDAFLAHTGRLSEEHANHVWAHEVKKRVDNNKEIIGQTVSMLGDLAGKEPNKIETYFAQAELNAHGPDVPPAETPILARQYKASVLDTAINKRIEAEDFRGAQALLDKHGKGLYDAKEVGDTARRIRQEGFANFEQKEKILAQTQVSIKKYRDAAKNQALGWGAIMESMGEVNTIPIEMRSSLATVAAAQDILGPKQTDALQFPKEFQRTKIDQYRRNVITQAVSTGNYDGVLARVKDEAGVETSWKGAQDITNQVNALKAKESEPGFRPKVDAGESLIMSQADPKVISILSPVEQAQARSQATKAVEQYHTLLAADPKQDPVELAKKVLESSYSTAKVKNQDVAAAGSLGELGKIQDDLVKSVMEQKSKGLMTKEKEEAAKIKLKEIKEQMNRLSIKSPQFESTPGGRPVGGQ